MLEIMLKMTVTHQKNFVGLLPSGGTLGVAATGSFIESLGPFVFSSPSALFFLASFSFVALSGAPSSYGLIPRTKALQDTTSIVDPQFHILSLHTAHVP